MDPVMLLGGQRAKYSGINLADAKALDLDSMTYTQQTPMLTQRSGHAACTLGDGHGLVVIGGSEGCWVPKSERTVPDKNFKQTLQQESDSAAIMRGDIWTKLPSMKTKRYGARACTLKDGRVLVAGGSNGECFLRSVEILDPRTESWQTGPDMLSSYAQFAMGVLDDGRVVVAGGVTSGEPGTNFRKAEIYDGLRWTPLPDMTLQRAFCAGCVCCGVLVVCGGEDEKGPTASCEGYDPRQNKWIPLGTCFLVTVANPDPSESLPMAWFSRFARCESCGQAR
jgi:hypothetical protein